MWKNLNKVVVILLSILVTVNGMGYAIEGNAQNCNNEGGRVFPKSIANIHCFSCMCRNGQVECLRNKCPDEDGCYMLQNEYTDNEGCCKRCRGCQHQGKAYDSGTEWRDENDPCLVMTCKAGVVTESILQCYTPCHSPFPPKKGECCPSCPGCRINGQNFSSNRNITLLEDPCLKCECDNGRMTCSKKACPVLQCPPSSVEWKPGECCPKCNGTRKLFGPPKGNCLLGLAIHQSGKTVQQDRCTFCSCLNATSICRRETCPILDCPVEKQVYVNHDKCCPQCPPQYENKTTYCSVGDAVFQDGDSWQASECKSCICNRGQIRCAVETCSHSSNMLCPPNMKLHKDPGACCPRCVEEDGVCTVFGDPHYKTFDGKFYSFQGSCKYQLTGDCVGQQFYIRVTNDARSTKTSAWTKNVSIRMGSSKINLGDKMRVKVNGLRVSLPYKNDTLATVTKTSENVLVMTNLGVKVIWDGNSFLEVSVPTKYKGCLCGLCGNYNAVQQDDFRTRDGRIVPDAAHFARSWQVGGRKACPRPIAQRRAACPSHNRKMRERACKPLRSDIFSACYDRLHPEIYYKSCLIDMCECPSSRKCYCESLTAYAHECQRLGILLPDWRSLTGCSMQHAKYY